MKRLKEIKKHLKNFRTSFINNVIGKPTSKDDGLPYWRASIMFVILLTALILSLVALISSIPLTIKENNWQIFFIDLFAYCLAFYLLFSRKLKYRMRTSIGLILTYFVGLTFIIYMGPLSAGPFWLFTFAILTALLLGFKPALLALAVNGMTLAVFAWLIKTGEYTLDFSYFNSLIAIIITILNFLTLNLIASLSIIVLINGLISAHQNEQRLTQSLHNERQDLISAKKKLETEVIERKNTEEKYRFLAENVNDIIWMLELHDLKFSYISSSVKKILGYELDEALNLTLDKSLTPDSYQKAMSILTKELNNDTNRDPDRFITLELEQYRKDGTVIWTELTMSFVRNSEKQPAAILGITRDISERKKAEEELREKDKTFARMQKMESLGLMAGGIAHDLNNILSGIVSYPDLLLFNLPEDDKLRKYAERIKESGLNASSVVSDLLTVTRGVATDRKVSNLNSLIEQYLTSPEHKQLIKQRPHINFITQLDSNLLNINVSPTHIKKVLMNLAANAVDAIQDKGNVIISTINRYIDEPLKGYEEVRHGEYILLNISDDGVGMPPEHLQKIFEPFYTKKMLGRSGTGLGLTVVWNAIKDHDGYINVKSDDNGTEFQIFIPATREQVDESSNDISNQEYMGNGEQILIVDDEKTQRTIAGDLLNQLGYRSDAVPSGEQAIEYFQNNSADVILLDMVMPGGINGYETYKKILQINPDQKAVIASGYAQTTDVKETQKLGAGKYIKKPYTIEEIGMAIKTELKK